MSVLKRFLKRGLFLFSVLTLAGGLLLPALAIADDMAPPDPEKVKEIENKYQCPDNLNGITYRAVECVRSLLATLSDTAFVTVIQRLNKAIFAVMVIAIALMGMKVALGASRNMKGEAFTALMKVVMVAFLVFSVDGFGSGENGLKTAYTLISDVSRGLVKGVGENLNVDTGQNGQCVQDDIWQRADCIILAFVGQKDRYIDANCNGQIDDEERQVLLRDYTLFGFAMSQLFTPHGMFILVLIIVAALMIMFSFAIGMFIYIISMVALTFLFMMGPLFVPMFLFQQTKRIFFTWTVQIINYMIQPALMVAFLSFLLAVMNVAMFGDGTANSPGLVATMGKLQTSMEENECTRKTLVYSSNAILGEMADRVVGADEVAQRLPGEQVDAIPVPWTPVDYTTLALFIIQLLGCIVLLYVMLGLMKNVGELTGQLSAGTGGALSKFIPGASKASGMASDFARGAIK